MRLSRLPGWVIDNDRSVREEVAPFVEVTMAERWEATRRCCRAARRMLSFHAEPERLLQHRDALSADTEAALARLRKQVHGR